MPSAIVDAGDSVTRVRASSARCIDGSDSAWTPITRTSGRTLLIASATPAMSPPPPTGTRMASMSGRCSRSSSPSEPCPATTRASSNGCTKVSPRAVATSQARP